MKLIVAVDQYFGIGKEGKLLTYIPEDLEFFKQQTMGQYIIMGRKTIDSLPKGKLLPNRETWILTRDKNYVKEGALVFHAVQEVLDYIKEHHIDDSRVFIAGGATIYEQFLPYCEIALITKIEDDFKADVHMINVHEHPEWSMSYCGEMKESRGNRYQHTTYRRVK